MKKRYISILGFCLLLLSNLATASTEKFQEANKNFSNGEIDKAISIYEELIDEGFSSHPLYYNLGVAQFKNENFAQAALWFERALRLKPNDENTKFNIEVTKYKITDKIEAVPELFLIRWIKDFRNLFNEKTWSIISIISFIFTLILIAIFLTTSIFALRKSSFYVGILSIIIFLVSFNFGYFQKRQMQRADEGIIFSEFIEVRSSPDSHSKKLFIIHEGLKVQIVEKIGNWIEIKLPNGDKGWIEEENVEII